MMKISISFLDYLGSILFGLFLILFTRISEGKDGPEEKKKNLKIWKLNHFEFPKIKANQISLYIISEKIGMKKMQEKIKIVLLQIVLNQ